MKLVNQTANAIQLVIAIGFIIIGLLLIKSIVVKPIKKKDVEYPYEQINRVLINVDNEVVFIGTDSEQYCNEYKKWRESNAKK